MINNTKEYAEKELNAMTVSQLISDLDLTVFHLEDPDQVVTGGYAGDLLSWVMGKAQPGDAWITIMSNINVAAVAVLCDTACVILAEQVVPDEKLMAKAQQQGINLLGSAQSVYRLCGQVGALLQ
jgi:hypothetical protein